MDDLIAFLSARLGEQEDHARRLLGIAQETSLALKDPTLLGKYIPGWYSWGDVETLCAATLREVTAKRKRLALYLDAKEALAVALKNAPPEDDPAVAHSYVRERINVNQASGRFTALEMSVRLDATVYSDHPDYQQEWPA